MRDEWWAQQDPKFAATYREAVEGALTPTEVAAAFAPNVRMRGGFRGIGLVTNQRVILVARDGTVYTYTPSKLAVGTPTTSGTPVRFPDGVELTIDAGREHNLQFGSALVGLVLRPPSASGWKGQATYVGGHGFELVPNAAYTVTVRARGGFSATAGDGTKVASVPDDEITDVSVDGPGRYLTGGGWVGGGLGLSGAIEGAAIASVLNGLTTQVHVQTLLRLGTRRTVAIFNTQVDRPELELLLSGPIQAAAARRTEVVTTTEGESDLVSKIERLAALHSTGMLTADEFAAAKRQLIGTTSEVVGHTATSPRAANDPTEGMQF